MLWHWPHSRAFRPVPAKIFTEVSTRWPRDKRKAIRKSASLRRRNPRPKPQHLCSQKGQQRPIKCRWASVRIFGNWVLRWLVPDQAPPADKLKLHQYESAFPLLHRRGLQPCAPVSRCNDRPAQTGAAHRPLFPTNLAPAPLMANVTNHQPSFRFRTIHIPTRN